MLWKKKKKISHCGILRHPSGHHLFEAVVCVYILFCLTCYGCVSNLTKTIIISICMLWHRYPYGCFCSNPSMCHCFSFIYFVVALVSDPVLLIGRESAQPGATTGTKDDEKSSLDLLL